MGYIKPSTEFYCKDHCLFDILTDPCELTPLNKKKILSEGKMVLEVYRNLVVPPIDSFVDEMANPRRFGGVWSPWLDTDSPLFTEPPTFNVDTVSLFLSIIFGGFLLCAPKLFGYFLSP